MLKWLEPILPYIPTVLFGILTLLCGFACSYPFRKYTVQVAQADGGGSEGARPWGQFFGAILGYIAFPTVVLILSSLITSWMHGANTGAWPQLHQAWLCFWGIYLLLRIVEGLSVEVVIQIRGVAPMSRLSRSLLRTAIMLGVAFMLIKYQLGYNITVLLTSTAILTGVVGFAMQGVLGNLLAGMSLHACRSISAGDWLEVDGTIGQVVLVNWRETRLRTRGGHFVIVPNGKLADQTIRNFSSPTSLRRHEVPVAASYGDAPGDVIEALVEACSAVPDVLSRPYPKAHVTGFKDFCIEYVLVFWSRHYERKLVIDGEVMRQIWYKFQRRGIEIPFPMSGRLLGNFLEAVHAQQFEKPLAREVRRTATDLLHSDFGSKLLADDHGNCRLSLDDLLPLAREINRVKYTRGETVMTQGDDGQNFYVLVSGTLAGQIAGATPDDVTSFNLAPGAVFGEMSLLTGLPRSATITAETDCELLEFDQECFGRLLSLSEEIPQVLSDLAASRASENAEAFEKLKALAVVPPVLAKEGILHRLSGLLTSWRKTQ